MKLIDALLGEHGAFYALFDSIEQMASTSGDIAQIDTAMAVLATELNAHAAFEEKLLFPALERHTGTKKLLAEMVAEHQDIRHGLERIENARDINEAAEAVQQTMAAARRHFRKEETVLYPLAKKVLDDETLTQLGEAWAAARAVKNR
jgi:hemerythrin-like domain-containing protein